MPGVLTAFKRTIFTLTLIAALLPRAEAQETDPLSVVQRLNAAVKAGDVEAAVALFADDAVIVNTRGRRTEGKAAIRAFWRATIAEGASAPSTPTAANSTIAGDKITRTRGVTTDYYRKLGVAPLTHGNEATVRDGKITRYFNYIPHAEIDRLEKACAAPQAAGLLIYGRESCAEYVQRARANTDAMLALPTPR
jgi:hypothetical protein